MLLNPESPLRQIPIALERSHGFFLEGFRVTVEMIDLAHSRLQQTLLALRASKQASVDCISAELDAWSIIDCAHRLRGLIQHFPGLKVKKINPAFHYFMKNSKQVEDLRNTVQHLPSTIRHLHAIPDWSVWGALSWCSVAEGATNGTLGVIICGKV